MANRIGGAHARRKRVYLKEWRTFCGFTGERLAEEAEATKASISRIECGKQRLTDEAATAFAIALGIPVKVLTERLPRPEDRAAFGLDPEPVKKPVRGAVRRG